MAMDATWEYVPANLLRAIVRRVPCEADRIRVAAACRSWRAALAPPQLPHLLLPLSNGPYSFCLHSGRTRRMLLPPDARYFGSYDGGWLLLASGQTRGHMILNARTDERIGLPNNARLPTSENVPMVILAATLSSPPVPEQCVAAGISICPHFRSRLIPFWRLGHPLAMCHMIRPARASLEVEDVIYHRGAFHFLTEGEHIRVCTPSFNQDGYLLDVDSQLRLFLPGGRTYNHYVGARYLVESRGRLLMVVRFAPHPGLLTSAFRVFRMRRLLMPIDQCRYTWVEVPTLGGRMLFVGRGCSRSYEVADFPGFEDGVYFLDDNSFYDEATKLPPNVSNWRYPCIDNGKWSGTPPHVDRCFQPEQDLSEYSPPVWLLP